MARLLTIVGLFAAFAAFTTGASAQSYDDLCDQMIAHAQRAARAHNLHKFDDVEEHQQKVAEYFAKAVAMDPSEPQAYLTMATFQSNSHQYDESILNFDKVLEILEADKSGADNDEMIQRIVEAKTIANYKKFSKLRDEAYEGGEGNVTLAHKYALEQVNYSPEPHRTNHQLATLEAMLCEYDKPMCGASHMHFRVASFATFQHVTKTYSEALDDSLRMHCFHSHLHMGTWGASAASAELGGPFARDSTADESHPSRRLHPFVPTYANNTREDMSASNSGIYANTLRGIYDIVGPDGIIIANMAKGLNSGDCNVFVQNGDYYVNLADNLFPNPTNNANGPAPMRPPPSMELAARTRVLSLVHFASSTFYHWMAEALPRLAYFRRAFPEAESYKILITAAHPNLKNKKALPKFVRESLAMFGVDIDTDVIAYNPNAGLTVDSRAAGSELVAVTWDPSPCPGETSFSDDIADRRMCASLTPFEPLQAARDVLSYACIPHSDLQTSPDPYVIVVGRGKNVPSRGLNTTRIAEQLLAAAAERIELLDTRPVDSAASKGLAAPLAPKREEYGDNGARLATPNERQIRVIEFNGDDHSLGNALRLFRHATLVVGPHGGAMANIMACEAGKTSVLEIGLSTVAAQHYKHMAIGLGLRYRRLVAGPDRLGRALNAPRLIARTDVIVNNAIELLLGQLGKDVAVRRTKIPPGPAAPVVEPAAASQGGKDRMRFGVADEAPASDMSYTRRVEEDRPEDEDEDDDDDEL